VVGNKILAEMVPIKLLGGRAKCAETASTGGIEVCFDLGRIRDPVTKGTRLLGRGWRMAGAHSSPRLARARHHACHVVRGLGSGPGSLFRRNPEA